MDLNTLSLPSTSNSVNEGVRIPQRHSNHRLATLLGISEDEDGGMYDAPICVPDSIYTDEDDDLAQLGGVAETLVAKTRAPSFGGHDVSDEQALIGGPDGVKARGKGNVRQRLAGFMPFRRRKAASTTLFGRAMLPSRVPEGSSSHRDPSEDWDAIQHDTGGSGGGGEQTAEDAETATHDEGFHSAGSATGQWMTFPTLVTPIKAQSFSAPTTPRRSPRSARSRHTPGSAKSWLSELSASSELSAMSSLRRKTAKRKARLSLEPNPQMKSMKKSIQLLGPEAAGVVARGTDVSPNKLRYIDFGRQMRDYMRRYM
ncbi:hypothetical protein BD309DRAFT_962544 [Dichomitus squalens]|nr:hypothetical protein BD309DRAFT_962544 [Dichomitus squalens]